MAGRKKADAVPQSSMHETIIDDADLMAQCAIYVQNAAAVKARTKAKKAIDSRLETMPLKAGMIVRCGPFVMPIVDRAGGGFRVDRWEKKAAGKIQDTTGTAAGPPPVNLDF